MEADWEIEVGGDAPVIDAHWSGWVDLTASPQRATQLPEVSLLPELAKALIQLNGSSSPLWTAKCDVWQQEEFDPDELNAGHDDAELAMACYVDLLPRSQEVWATVDQAADWCRRICHALQTRIAQCCRVDLVVRTALLQPETWGWGVTAYVTGCGKTADAALRTLESALSEVVRVLVSSASPPQPSSQLQ